MEYSNGTDGRGFFDRSYDGNLQLLESPLSICWEDRSYAWWLARAPNHMEYPLASGINGRQIQCAIHNRRMHKVLMYKDILYTESHRNEAILIAVKYTRR
jgi:hypothetical protein